MLYLTIQNCVQILCKVNSFFCFCLFFNYMLFYDVKYHLSGNFQNSTSIIKFKFINKK